jgi:CRISPR-associated protein (TIGR03985 family)
MSKFVSNNWEIYFHPQLYKYFYILRFLRSASRSLTIIYTITVYPVCLHYSCCAKYLSAYGIDPHGNTGWHNYRLDRIASAKLQILAWGDSEVPPGLQLMWQSGTLPTPQQVEQQLAAAWGFNFYLQREFLIMRFPPDFARWYVDNTVRHQSFKPIVYSEIRKLVKRNISISQQLQKL